MKRLLLLTTLVLITACSGDNFPSYKSIENTIPDGGLTIDYDPNNTLTNIPDIESQLSEDHQLIFNESLSWYGTEANFGFEYIHKKTAHELVEIVNCLKTTPPESQKTNCLK
ncbi:hypothetical protein M3P05_19870 [Sansalvadorimonas sp. 2012CJ34-2]|uniref:Uncharacterized protein n=1 Tax=Parendozoicomonas callyspongiae TaxID=2942213 RepID=A0ABT0PN68_9GAMM|nr:hypothetical protein [Sansalvadorimonas sp. 2012CJ34-2]MCL6272182.1 hypothetical protein [Sansalvadorimonas sp. 2012CJ34-2]